jgi:hypothetical protein
MVRNLDITPPALVELYEVLAAVAMINDGDRE